MRVRRAGGARSHVRSRLFGDDYTWCFVLGVNNSGTSLLNRLLGRHPEIHVLPLEGQKLTDAFPQPLAFGVPRSWSRRLDLFRLDERDSDDDVERIVFHWLHHYPAKPGVLVEKSPPNTLRSRWLQAHFAPARFIAIVRNPFAVAEGVRRREGHPLEVGAEHWRQANEILLDDLGHLEHHRLIRYEDLCRAPLDTLDAIRELLGLSQPFRAEMFDGRHAPDARLASIEDRNAQSIAGLDAEEIDRIARIVAPVSERLGYERPR
jgi:hypothetical protein